MRIYNADGSEAEMCGNGIRCMARLLIRDRGHGPAPVVIDTQDGLKTVNYESLPGGGEFLEVEMGVPVFGSEGGEQTVALGGRTVLGTPVSMGNPHFVVFVEQVDGHPVERDGPALSGHPSFPEGTNVEFVQILDKEAFKQRTWERGAGETLACGTGASASAAVAMRRGLVESPVKVELRGGTLRIRWNPPEPLFMAGEAVEVFRGEIDIST
jgi:diaminopimelate epimerase